MLKKISTIALLLLCSFSFAQISIRPQVATLIVTDTLRYDSLNNFQFNKDAIKYNSFSAGEVRLSIENQLKKHIGQKVFKIPYTQQTMEILKALGKLSKDSLEGKYFTITDINVEEEAVYTGGYEVKRIVFNLSDELNKSHEWYSYCHDPLEQILDETFLIVGYYDKLKETILNKVYYDTGRPQGQSSAKLGFLTPTRMSLDLNTNDFVNIKPGSKWTCVDLQLIDCKKQMRLCAILRNDIGNEIAARISDIELERGESPTDLFSCYMNETDFTHYTTNLEKKYGEKYARMILDKEIAIGMTKAMCVEIYGMPLKVNKTLFDGREKEQWIYSSNYFLYFYDGILESVQEM